MDDNDGVSIKSDCENDIENAEIEPSDVNNGFPAEITDSQAVLPDPSSLETAVANGGDLSEENSKATCELEQNSVAADVENNGSAPAKEINVEEKMNNMTMQDVNGCCAQAELTGEDNLHGLSLPIEVYAQPESDNTDVLSIDSQSIAKTDKYSAGDKVQLSNTQDHSHKFDNETPESKKPEITPQSQSETVTNVRSDSPSKSVPKPSVEAKEKLDQEVQNMMNKNIEKFSPKKEPKPILNPQLAKTPDASSRPRRVNPFNHAEAAEEVDSDIWRMQPPGPSSSISLQALSSYGQQPHPNFQPGNYSTSEHSFLANQMPQRRVPQNYNSSYSQNHHMQFELMPPATRVRPLMENPTDFEDVDAIIKEAKSRRNRRQQEQSPSDPWVKMEQPPQNLSPDDPEPCTTINDFKNRHNNVPVSPCSSYREHQEREPHVSSSSGEHRRKDVAPPASYTDHEKRDIPRPSLVRPLIEAAGPCEPEDLIEGIIFTAHYLGSTQLQSERNPGKNARMMQAQEAVSRIKAPEGESQPSVEVDLFISTDKVKILNADTQETMMDHTLRSISYIADIGKLLVIMAKRRAPQSENQDQNQIVRDPKPQRSYRVICHVFSSHDAQLMAQAIGQAFSVAYQQFLTANGIEPQTLTKDDYNQLLDMQEMYHDDLVHYSKQENIKDIWVEKNKGENLGVVIVESGWGSIVPTVILANLQHGGPAERCGKLKIGDQIMTVNGTSLVGLPLATCQSIIKGLKSQSIARLNIISCPPVVTVLIKRPDLKYQLGFSVQDGIICSLMRGGIAERGGVRVGHRIIEINNQSVVATPHEKIVQTLVSSVGEIQMKTMPAMMYRLLTGQEQPIYI